MTLSRRSLMQGALLGGAALTGGVALEAAGLDKGRALVPRMHLGADVSRLSPSAAALASQSFALGDFFPALMEGGRSESPLIVNTLSGAPSLANYVRQGGAGNAFFQRSDNGRAVVPWTPIFAREGDRLVQLPTSVTRQLDCADLLVMNESSPHYPVFGNKARKYEFLLPNLKWSGSEHLGTLGAVSSNHALQFALANRMADLTGNGEPLNCPLDLVLFEVPGVATDMARLSVLRNLVRSVSIAKNDAELVGEAAYEYASNWLHPTTNTVVPPGGSNELSVLGHMNAIAELARLLESAQVWKEAPDVIFVAMGSGSTVLGLLLGVHLMGWKTKIVGVADQDKSYLTRLLVNRQPSVPFVQGNVAKLARSTVDWLQRINFPGISPDVLSAMEHEMFMPDSTSWGPGYGLVESADVAWADQLKEAGIGLDPVFTLKAWRSLLTMSKAGALKDKKVLFWNTYNSFDYMPTLLSSLG
jgi:1-aminocyclopropane-1-carboxylate deaminase/D-cysteine desulfhydrase-like pyridoxal-dependent ACC family enzyme